MLTDHTEFSSIYVCCRRIDLRKGIDGLAALVQEQFNLSPFQKNAIFLFCGSKQDRFKALVWEGDGFLLLYKRIEGGRLRWPRNAGELEKINPEEFRRLLRGMTILEKPLVHQVYSTKTA